MRASTVGSRFLDRCGDSLGVEISFKDICILAAVLNSRCRSKFGPYLRASLRLAVMGLFRDSRDRRDLSLKVCWTLAVWLMTQQLRCDVNEADEAEQRRLERHPESGHAGAVLAAARLASDGEHLANGLPVAHAWPVVGPRMATAAAAMPFATCVALAPGAHTSAAVARMPWATCEVVAPSAGVVVDAGHGRNVVGPRSRGRVNGDGVVSMPALFKKTKRMDRRLSHWQCTFCRHETALSEQVDVCGKCNGARRQLGDSDAVARESARRLARSKEAHGRALNARGVGCETVPRVTLGIFEQARYEAMVAWEVNELERYAGAPSYLRKEEYNIGIIESFFIVHRGAAVSCSLG